MAIRYVCPPLPMPCNDQEQEHLWYLQTPEFVQFFETQSWNVMIDLGIFGDGKYFLRLEVLEGAIPLRLSCYEGMPLHITLGKSRRPLREAWLASMVQGEYRLELTKWTNKRTSSTYLPKGQVEELCDWLELYFSPRGQWHMSL